MATLATLATTLVTMGWLTRLSYHHWQTGPLGLFVYWPAPRGWQVAWTAPDEVFLTAPLPCWCVLWQAATSPLLGQGEVQVQVQVHKPAWRVYCGGQDCWLTAARTRRGAAGCCSCGKTAAVASGCKCCQSGRVPVVWLCAPAQSNWPPGWLTTLPVSLPSGLHRIGPACSAAWGEQCTGRPCRSALQCRYGALQLSAVQCSAV